jgi:hypothetical protein
MGRGSHVLPNDQVLDGRYRVDPDALAAVHTAPDDVALVGNPDPDPRRPNECRRQPRYGGIEPTILVTNPTTVYNIPVGRYLAECLSADFSPAFIQYLQDFILPFDLGKYRAHVIGSLHDKISS